ncbi:WW/Rsp5/WWP [Penicillium paradoxum]|uniref:WW/Rsp5/WWP n=1 Tax=Penicillium paradoxum TaxID=176176 RepID=UPI0025494EFC|nr:WW/Rsp5/WWP [Penicillium paradoxum]KAJ5787049.1 WW/Rsp5/WWP [Penicillium paradoxum]
MSSHDHADSESEIAVKMESRDASNGNHLRNGESRTSSRSPLPPKQEVSPNSDASSAMKPTRGDILLKQEPGQPAKLSRSSSQKVASRPPPLYTHLPDSTQDALATFEQIPGCIYANKYMGYTEHAMECDCAEEWDQKIGRNIACGEDSDCINRATKIECAGDCGCGADCQNQRFQKKQFAPVSVIKTEKKGFGLRAETNLDPGELIYEYVGEVVGEAQFRKRMRQYDDEGIKHFYFMSLNKGEFVDATKRGNLGRFCNHSCNPNCYVDKWVVGEKLRMGIFAERAIQAGEELVFNYNVDRYGADPQPCYCGEPMCTGFIGGRTQTERATKLSNATIEALGIDEADGWDTVVAKRPKKKKMEEDDEEYVDSVQPKSLDEDGVTKVMAALVQCQEKWIAVKLLGRIQRCDDERVRNRVIRMHGYQILNSQLAQWKEDQNVVLQIMNILDGFPRLTRNKIQDSKIEANIQPLTKCDDERVAKKAVALLESWAGLEVAYRIPRMKRGKDAKQAVNQFERRETGRERSRTRSPSPVYDAPRAPAMQRRDRGPQRARQQNRRGLRPLPEGWYTAEADGRVYYYSASGKTTWERPTLPATPATPATGQPARNQQSNLALQSIIDGIMNTQEDTPSEHRADTPLTPQPSTDQPDKRQKDGEKWRKLPLDKQKRIYENTLFPFIKPVVDQYKHKIPDHHLKRFAKEIAKKLVESDYKKNRVSDPTAKIPTKHQQTVKNYCKTFFRKAAAKYVAREKLEAEKSQSQGADPTPGDELPDPGSTKVSDDEVDVLARDPASSPLQDDDAASLKRKRSKSLGLDTGGDGASSPAKQQKSTPPPPPPPPPPAENPMHDDADGDTSMGNAGDDPSPPPPKDGTSVNGDVNMETDT